MRGQANLTAVGVALVVLTAATGIGVALADGAFASATRQPGERRAAVAASERLIAPDAPTTVRANVLRRGAVRTLTPAALEQLAPPVTGAAVRLRLAGETVLERGDPAGGVTIRRLVLVGEASAERRTLALAEDTTLTLPRRTDRVRLTVQTPPGTTVHTVTVNDRVVLHRDAGLAGTATVRTSRYGTATVAVETRGPARGTVTVTYYPRTTTKAVLAVTVDA